MKISHNESILKFLFKSDFVHSNTIFFSTSLWYSREKNFKNRDVAWTTEINRGQQWLYDARFEKSAVLCVLTAVFIVAVIAGYMYRGLHTGNRGI